MKVKAPCLNAGVQYLKDKAQCMKAKAQCLFTELSGTVSDVL